MVAITDKQKAIINRLNHSLYTVEFLQEWLNKNNNVFVNAIAALQAIGGASGFYDAVIQIEKLEYCK